MERQAKNELPVAGHFVGWCVVSERRLTGTERSKISVYTITERERVNRYVWKNTYDVVDIFNGMNYIKYILYCMFFVDREEVVLDVILIQVEV